jgi:hypothetical protein
MNKSWYKLIEGHLPINQGDIIDGCPVVIPPSEFLNLELSLGDRFQAKVEEYNVIVISHSCDLEHKKLKIVQVCPVYPLTEVRKNPKFIEGKDVEDLRRGNRPGYHLLDQCIIPDYTCDYLVVEFCNTFGVSFDFLSDYVKDKNRIRLLSPYREHLSQAFARFFMRVALPSDIPKFS